MHEFTNPSNKEKFNALKKMLEDRPGTTRVFHQVQLPPNCSPASTRLGFRANKKEQGGFSYTVYIDKNITYNGPNLMFKLWLEDGDWQFPSYEQMVMFFHSQLKGV